jgi:hypothetical protein
MLSELFENLPEIGDPEKIADAIRQLCDDGQVHEEPEGQEVKQEEPEIIDLTLDEEDEHQSSFIAVPMPTPNAEEHLEDVDLSQTSSSDVVVADLSALAEDETRMTITELLECLHADELKKFAKQMKLKLTGTV